MRRSIAALRVKFAKPMEVEFLLKRKHFTELSTIGELFVHGRYICDILEDKDRGLDESHDIKAIIAAKVYGHTAIPTGRYEIMITYSPKYKKDVPEVTNVKGWKGIRIHSGNVPDHTEGCLIPGIKDSAPDKVMMSKDATAKVNTIIKVAIDEGKRVFIKITK